MLLPHEFRKIFQKRLFLSMLPFLFLTNIFLLWYVNEGAEQAEKALDMSSQYYEFLLQVDENADVLSGISIFSKEVSDGFSSRNIQKTKLDYEKIRTVYSAREDFIQYDVSYGLESASTFVGTDILAFLFLFLFSFIMIFEEKNKNLYAFIKPTPLGKVRTMEAKIGVLAIYTGMITLLLYGTNFVFYHFTSGLGDLSRSIQSVPLFMGSTLVLSVRQFILYFLLLKWLACFAVGLLVLFASILLEGLFTAFGICSLCLLVSFLLYTYIPNNSKRTMLKHMNFFGLFRVQDMLGTYLNLNVFGHPVSLFGLRLFVLLFLSMGIGIGSILVFGYSNSKGVSLPGIGHSPVFTQRSIKSIFYYECYKILWIQKGGVLLIGFFGMMIYQVNHFNIYLYPEEMMYRSYMERLAGPITQEKEEFLLEEQQKMGDENVGYFQSQAFEKVWENYQYNKEIPNGEFVYESGYYEWWFQVDKGDISYLFVCILIVMGCYAIFAYEYEAGMDKLLSSSPRGQHYLARTKWRISILYTTAMSIFGFLPEIIYIGKAYGFPSLSAPLISLEKFRHMPSFLSIGWFLFLCMVLRMLSCFVVMTITLILSKFLGNSIYVLLICSLGIVLPLLLYNIGLGWCGYFSFLSLIHGGELYGEQRILQVMCYTLAAIAIAAFGGKWTITVEKR